MAGSARTAAATEQALIRSDLSLLRQLERVVDLDAEIPDGARQLRVTEQDLHRPQVFRPPIDQRLAI